jgi:maltose/moltooligosaccharide transporter
MLVSGIMQKNNTTDNGFVTIMNDFQFMPTIMKQLALVQFLVFYVDLYPGGYTNIYGTTDTTSEAYNTGADQVGEMFANYNLIAALAACRY